MLLSCSELPLSDMSYENNLFRISETLQNFQKHVLLFLVESRSGEHLIIKRLKLEIYFLFDLVFVSVCEHILAYRVRVALDDTMRGQT